MASEDVKVDKIKIDGGAVEARCIYNVLNPSYESIKKTIDIAKAKNEAALKDYEERLEQFKKEYAIYNADPKAYEIKKKREKIKNLQAEIKALKNNNKEERRDIP